MKKTAPTKTALRRTIRLRRKKLSAAWIAKASSRIARRVTAMSAFQSAKTVACYLALPHEVQTEDLLATCFRENKKVCVPALSPDKQSYELSWLRADASQEIGPFGIPQPRMRRRAPANKVDIFIIPGVAFDSSGHRLGHGGGHFDRLLAHAKGFKAGLAFELQMTNRLFPSPHDVAVDAVVTERKTYVSRNRQNKNKMKQNGYSLTKGIRREAGHGTDR